MTRGLGVAALKYSMDCRGYYGGPVRSPLLELTAAQKKQVDDLFNAIRHLN